jgi:hypothetical protein
MRGRSQSGIPPSRRMVVERVARPPIVVWQGSPPATKARGGRCSDPRCRDHPHWSGCRGSFFWRGVRRSMFGNQAARRGRISHLGGEGGGRASMMAHQFLWTQRDAARLRGGRQPRMSLVRQGHPDKIGGPVRNCKMGSVGLAK